MNTRSATHVTAIEMVFTNAVLQLQSFSNIIIGTQQESGCYVPVVLFRGLCQDLEAFVFSLPARFPSFWFWIVQHKIDCARADLVMSLTPLNSMHSQQLAPKVHSMSLRYKLPYMYEFKQQLLIKSLEPMKKLLFSHILPMLWQILIHYIDLYKHYKPSANVGIVYKNVIKLEVISFKLHNAARALVNSRYHTKSSQFCQKIQGC